MENRSETSPAEICPVRITADRGTILLSDGAQDFDLLQLPHTLLDPRTSAVRAQGRYYRVIVEHLLRERIKYDDQARGWLNQNIGWQLHNSRKPHPHQAEAVQAWWQAGKRGVVVLPTGTGKTFVAILAITKIQRPTLVVTPTLELMRQWHSLLSQDFQITVGAVGGGDYDYQDLTVTTYDSAHIHLDRWAHRFAFVIYDECHHLPGGIYQESAIGALAPFRLGLTATPERSDVGESLYPEMIGPIIYRREITELAGEYLAEYTTNCVPIDLTPTEQSLYKRCRDIYRQFVQQHQISLSGADGWKRFVFVASRSADGQAALKAFRQQKQIVRSAEGKFREVEAIFRRHATERILIFTADNATVYQIARKYLVPAITHQTRIKERKEILQRFHEGIYQVIVTSQVLNEGVDVPAASVGVIFSGSGSIKENVQRLGRILRKYGDKQATLYELVTTNTTEQFTSERRRQHQAFE